jgi:cell division protein FtsW (lipid II flippase)
MRKTASMLGMAAAGAVVLYGAYSYLQRRKEKQTNEIINDIVCHILSFIFLIFYIYISLCLMEF